MGLVGVAIANTVSASINLLMQYVMVNHVISDLSSLFNWPDKTMFTCDECGKLIKPALERIFINLSDMWTIPILVLMAVNQETAE